MKYTIVILLFSLLGCSKYSEKCHQCDVTYTECLKLAGTEDSAHSCVIKWKQCEILECSGVN